MSNANTSTDEPMDSAVKVTTDARCETQDVRNIDTEDILEELRAIFEIEGDITKETYQEFGDSPYSLKRYDTAIVSSRVGDWEDTVFLANINPDGCDELMDRREYPTEELLRELRYAHHRNPREQLEKTLEDDDLPPLSVYKDRFFDMANKTDRRSDTKDAIITAMWLAGIEMS